jgi:hypothetical protein
MLRTGVRSDDLRPPQSLSVGPSTSEAPKLCGANERRRGRGSSPSRWQDGMVKPPLGLGACAGEVQGKGSAVSKSARQFLFLPPYLLLSGLANSLLQICAWYRVDLPREPQGFFALVIKFEVWLGYSGP